MVQKMIKITKYVVGVIPENASLPNFFQNSQIVSIF